MSKKTISTFVQDIKTVLERNDTDVIKIFIGDSVDNHRVVSVNQLVRFLTESNSTRYKSLGRRLNNVRVLVGTEPRLHWGSNRTDAVDSYELLDYLTMLSLGHSGSVTRNWVKEAINS